MRVEVFVPLGMTHSSVLIPDRLDEFKSIRYSRDGTPLPFFDTDNRGGGAIYSSAHDMVRFGMFMLEDHLADQKAILSEEQIDEMVRPTARDDRGRGIGVAWQHDRTNRDVALVEHRGSMPGATAGFTFVPGADVAIVVLSNGDRVSVTRIRDLVLEALGLADPPQDDQQEEEKPPAGFHPGPELAGTWEGAIATYQGDTPLRLEIRVDGDIHARLGSELPTLLGQVAFDDGILEGALMGTIQSDDVKNRAYPHALVLRVRLRIPVDRRLCGRRSRDRYRLPHHGKS